MASLECPSNLIVIQAITELIEPFITANAMMAVAVVSNVVLYDRYPRVTIEGPKNNNINPHVGILNLLILYLSLE
jgi:hypothetical protein